MHFFLFSLTRQRKRTRTKKRSEGVERQHLAKDNHKKKSYSSIKKAAPMNSETKTSPPIVVTADEAISLIDDNAQVPIPISHDNRNEKNKSQMMLTRKTLIQNRLMRWCALLLALGTVIIIWRYLSILILAVWLSTICRPLLEWLVNHL